MTAIVFKVRITSPDPDSAELLRQALKAAFGDALTLSKARKGGNPKYADRPDVLAYGELELTRAELETAAGVSTATKAPARKKAPSPARRARKPAAPPAAPVAYTQQTISLSAPQRAPRARRKAAP